MQRRTLHALLSLVTATGYACGGDGDDTPAVDAPPVPANGTATISGTLVEQTVDPTTAFYKTHPFANQKVVVMNEGGAVCDLARRPPGLAAIIGFPCGDAEARAYDVKNHEVACDAAAPHVWILVENFDGEFPEYEAESGSATVTATDAGIAGSFTADFGEKGALTGNFNAVVCD